MPSFIPATHPSSLDNLFINTPRYIFPATTIMVGRTPPHPHPSVTELALLSLPAADGLMAPPILSSLAKAKGAMQRFSGQPFTYVHLAPEHPDLVLIIGGWPSVRFHIEEWIPCEENAAFVEELKGLGVGVRWMWHVGGGRGKVERGLFREVEEGDRGGERVRVWRAGVRREMVGEAERVLLAVDAGEKVDGGVKFSGQGWIGGWRIDEGFLGEGEQERSLRREGETEELVVVLRTGEDLQKTNDIEKVLGKLEGMVERLEVREGFVLDV
ncbi:uncharacterized protein HMPREF1541_07301 [Cyphellophora europaea CBS 101466]|uniref:Uncharacterized protein n=1 Tax=Cyphellophora europaea (strain CBS 101466) TaxID=1220924 RepID=W2RPP0_CYPE1|nr:uncharacterized protein HMPREF1541_07301 [Cyphellophora europaea CBS 101466]ETN37678.1 hypothetical protein HMPREF1541_07301 [Cyphellophora europaea CBS 101466]